MEKAIEHTLAVLREREYRVTAARKEIITALAHAKAPLPIQSLAQMVGADEASVYRTIKTLLDESLVEAIRVQHQVVHYALLHHHHHDHAVCEQCGVIAHVPCALGTGATISVPGFSVITSHEMTWYGLCSNCR